MPFSSGFQNSIETILNFPSRQWLLTSLHERERSIARFSHREIRLLSWELREEFETATSSVDSENSKYFKIAELAFVYFFYLVLVQTFFFFEDNNCTEQDFRRCFFMRCFGKKVYFPGAQMASELNWITIQSKTEQKVVPLLLHSNKQNCWVDVI